MTDDSSARKHDGDAKTAQAGKDNATPKTGLPSFLTGSARMSASDNRKEPTAPKAQATAGAPAAVAAPNADQVKSSKAAAEPTPPAKPAAQTQPAAAPKPPAKPAAKPAPAAAAVQVVPLAEPAQMRRRHWWLMASFVLFVIVPVALVATYMSVVAQNQYGSLAGFTVRQEEGGGASEIFGGLTQIVGGGNTGSDSEILFEFIQSQEMVNRIQERLDIRGHYAAHWPSDFAFSVWPDASDEDLLWFWQRVVRVSLDSGSGLMELRVLAYDPEFAQSIAKEIIVESQSRINALNEQARSDAMRYATNDLNVAVERLKEAREALTKFRSRTQIVDPQSDLEGRMGVMGALQEQLAAARVDYGLLRETTGRSDPRIQQALRRIEVIEEEIDDERNRFSGAQSEEEAENYPALIAEYESLTVDREFSEETYRAALAALDVARNKANRQSRYLATYISPTLAQTSEYPKRIGLSLLATFFLLLSWAIMALVYYSIRDRN